MSKNERATTATTEEFPQSIQAPSSTHPGISYPVRANPSLRYIYIYIYGDFPFVCLSLVCLHCPFSVFHFCLWFLHVARYVYYVRHMCSGMATFLTFFCSECHGNNRCRVHYCLCFVSWFRLLKNIAGIPWCGPSLAGLSMIEKYGGPSLAGQASCAG